MKKNRGKLTLPAIRAFREAIENGKIGRYMIESGENVGAGSVKVKYHFKNRPWVVTIEARRLRNG